MNKTFYLNSDFETKAVSNRKNSGLKIAGYANTTDRDRTGDIVTATSMGQRHRKLQKKPSPSLST